MQASLVRSIVEAPLAAVDLVVEDVTVTAAGRRSVVRIAVDRSLAGLANTDTTSWSRRTTRTGTWRPGCGGIRPRRRTASSPT